MSADGNVTSPADDTERLPSGGPTHGAVVLFIIAICSTILLAVTGSGIAIYTATHHTDVTRSQLQAVIAQQQEELRSDCPFFYPLAIAPLPPGVKPTKLGISIITASRAAYLGHSCGTLPPPALSLVKWAAYYRLPLR